MKPLPGQQSFLPAPRTARDLYDEPPPVPLNPSVPECEAPRLGAQHETILARLREGPATNVELGMICQRFGARLHELRLAGIGWSKTMVRPGVYEYRLTGEAAAE